MNNVDRFAVYQNDNTKETLLWIEKDKKWLRCQEKEFRAIKLLVDMLRSSPDASFLLEQIAQMVQKEGPQMGWEDGDELDEYGDPESW